MLFCVLLPTATVWVSSIIKSRNRFHVSRSLNDLSEKCCLSQDCLVLSLICNLTWYSTRYQVLALRSRFSILARPRRSATSNAHRARMAHASTMRCFNLRPRLEGSRHKIQDGDHSKQRNHFDIRRANESINYISHTD